MTAEVIQFPIIARPMPKPALPEGPVMQKAFADAMLQCSPETRKAIRDQLEHLERILQRRLNEVYRG